MAIELINIVQASQLQKGDIIKRSRATHLLDEDNLSESSRFDTYKVQSISPSNRILEMVMTGDSIKRFTSPWAKGRLFITSGELVSKQEWWV